MTVRVFSSLLRAPTRTPAILTLVAATVAGHDSAAGGADGGVGGDG